MITLPQLLTTDAELSPGLPTRKAADSAQDFLALLAGALGTGDAQAKDAPLSLADLKAASGRLQKGLLQPEDQAPRSVRLTDLLAAQKIPSDAKPEDLSDAQQLLSALTPTQKSHALAALSKSVQQDDKGAGLSDEDLASLSALFAMLPGQPLIPPANKSALADGTTALNTLLATSPRNASQDMAETLTTDELKKGKTDAAIRNAATDTTSNSQPLTPVVAAAAASANTEIESTPSPVTPGVSIAHIGSQPTHPQPQPTAAAPVLSAPLGSHEWQQSLSQHITLFTRQGQQSAELRLHPEDLGQVHISLKLDDNQAQLQMVSAHSHVRAALEAALPVLRTQLAESGIQLGQSSISSESFAGQQQSSSQQQQSSRTSAHETPAADDEIILAAPASLQAAARGNGAVDIFA